MSETLEKTTPQQQQKEQQRRRQQRLLDAVNFMITAKDYVGLLAEINQMIAQWERRKIIFQPDSELGVLNALVDLGVSRPDKFPEAISVIEAKRALRSDVRRANYQRELMQQRRHRTNKAIQLREVEQGRSFTTAEKDALAREINDHWRAQRNSFIAEQGRADFEGRNIATRKFWQMVDTKLELNLQQALKKAR